MNCTHFLVYSRESARAEETVMQFSLLQLSGVRLSATSEPVICSHAVQSFLFYGFRLHFCTLSLLSSKAFPLSLQGNAHFAIRAWAILNSENKNALCRHGIVVYSLLGGAGELGIRFLRRESAAQPFLIPHCLFESKKAALEKWNTMPLHASRSAD